MTSRRSCSRPRSLAQPPRISDRNRRHGRGRIESVEKKPASLVLLDLQLPDAKIANARPGSKPSGRKHRSSFWTAHYTLNNDDRIDQAVRVSFHQQTIRAGGMLSLVEKALEKQSLLRETQQLREKTVELEKRLEIAETR